LSNGACRKNELSLRALDIIEAYDSTYVYANIMPNPWKILSLTLFVNVLN